MQTSIILGTARDFRRKRFGDGSRDGETKKARYNYGPALFLTTTRHAGWGWGGVRVASEYRLRVCRARTTAPTAISSLNKHDIIKRTAADRQTLAN